MATTHVLTTRTKAPLVIVHVGPPAPTIEGYAYTAAAAAKRARKIGRFAVVAPVVEGKVTVEVPVA
jgi:hypothetical protein